MLKSHIHGPNNLKHVNLLLVCLLFFGIQLGLQFAGGAFNREFGGSPDEASHYITGLMMRDYIAGLKLTSPVRFAENYYLHYPKVAIGHWPPFFYVIQSTWTLLFSPSRLSLTLLMALLTTLLAGTVYRSIQKELGFYAGMGAGLLLIALPLMQKYSGMVMAEILLALLSLWAVLCFGRFLDTERWPWVTGFGICATLAILTKGNGLALAMVPFSALVFTRRFHLIARLPFWYPAVIVLVFCGPWYWLTLDMARNGLLQESPSLGFTLKAIPFYFYHLVKITGIPLSLFVAAGFVIRIIGPSRERRVEGKWATAGALLLSVLAFQSVMPTSLASRHLIMAVPALVMFLAAGITSTAARLPLGRVTNKRKVQISLLLVALVFTGEVFAIPNKTYHGFGKVAHYLLSGPDFRKSVLLISSDESGEGAFISEVAMREKRPSHIVLRASKVLARSRWDGSKYELIYTTPEKMMDYLGSIPVGIVLIDQSIPLNHRTEHHQLLKETLEVYTIRWELLGSYSLTRGEKVNANAIRVYRLVGHESRSPGIIRLDMNEMLGRSIEKTFEKQKP